MGRSQVQKSRKQFGKWAWASSLLSLMVGLSHVRAFPSYNLASSLVAFYASVQEDTETLLKSLTICAIMGLSTLLADVSFCFLWAREIIDGYSGVVKFCLYGFILNMFVKVALLYSAMIVAVSASSDDSDESKSDESDSDNESQHSITSMRSPKSFQADREMKLRAPTRHQRYHSEVEDQSFQDVDLSTPPRTPGIPGLISPGYNPRAYSP